MLTWEAKHRSLAYCLWYVYGTEHCIAIKKYEADRQRPSRLIAKLHCLIEKARFSILYSLLLCDKSWGGRGGFLLQLSSYINSFPLNGSLTSAYKYIRGYPVLQGKKKTTPLTHTHLHSPIFGFPLQHYF